MDELDDLRFIRFDKDQIIYIDAMPEMIEFDAEQQHFLIGFSFATYELLTKLGPGFIRIKKWSTCAFTATDCKRGCGCLAVLWDLFASLLKHEDKEKELPSKYSLSKFRVEQDEIAQVEIGFDLVGDDETILSVPLRKPADTLLVAVFKDCEWEVIFEDGSGDFSNSESEQQD